MISLVLQINEDVINEDDDKLVQVGFANMIHEIHERCWCISEPERHHQELVVTITSSECSLMHIFISNLQLMVT
ncbi:hypothetical protein Hanom_Chr12g01132271 [Helianthus anomalus]